jgi:hypothetical protein
MGYWKELLKEKSLFELIKEGKDNERNKNEIQTSKTDKDYNK